MTSSAINLSQHLQYFSSLHNITICNVIHLQIFSPPECWPHEGRDLVCLVLCSVACPEHSVLPVRVVQQILVKGMPKGNFPRVENMTSSNI